MLIVNPYIQTLDTSSNVFYGLVNNQWLTAANWSRGHVPTSDEPVAIRANCEMNFSAITTTVATLTVSPGITLSSNGNIGKVLAVTGDCAIYGTLNLSGVGTYTLEMNGTTNLIANYVSGNGSTIAYGRAGDQNVLNLSYNNLLVKGSGLKNLTSHLTLAGSVTLQGSANIQAGSYNITIAGTCTGPGNLGIVKSGAGTIIYGGACSNVIHYYNSSAIVEFRNGVTFPGGGGASFDNATVKFTTNNQNINGATSVPTFQTISIEGVEVSNIYAGSGIAILTGINGTTAGSKFINKGVATYSGSSEPMSTGVLDCGSFANTFYYNRTSAQTIKGTTYSTLTVAGSGVKTLNGNTVVAVMLNLSTTAADLQCSTYDLDLTAISGNGGAVLNKSGAGNVLFRGQANNIVQNYAAGVTVEYRNGIAFPGGSGLTTTATTTVKFTTNNQSIINGSGIAYFNGPVTVEGIELTHSANNTLVFLNTLNGTTVGSKYINKGVTHYSGTEPMQTGVLDCENFTNTFGYVGTTQTIKPITYSSLICDGGVKSLAINTLVKGALSGNHTIECGTYDLTVNGTTTVSTISKTGAGTIIFGGSVNSTSYVFSGNPNLEFKNGVTFAFGVNQGCVSGTGTWTFSTNNQNFNSGQFQHIFAKWVISGGITVSNLCPYLHYKSTTPIDGTASGSTFNNKGKLYYYNTTQPFPTAGTLVLNTNANTFYYAMDGDMNLWNYSYWSLGILTASGTKTAQQNLSLVDFDGGDVTISSTGTLQMGSYDLSVSGAANWHVNFKVAKSGGGAVTFGTGIANMGQLDLSGNPTLSTGGNIRPNSGAGANVNTGTGAWTITNNTVINLAQNFPVASSSITVGIEGESAKFCTIIGAGEITIDGVINGANGNAIFDNQGIVNYKNATRPMITGKLYCNQATNTWRYIRNGNQDIKVPNDPVNPGYQNLTLGGTATPNDKVLQGNLSVKGTYTVTGNAVRVDNEFSFGNP